MGLLDVPAYSRPQADSRFQRAANYMELPYGWDAGWKAAKAAQATTPATVLFTGDSLGAGQGSTDWLNNGWVGKSRAALLTAGSTAYADHYPACVYGTTLSSQAGTMPYTTFLTGGSIAEAGYGRAYVASTGATTQTVFSIPSNAVKIEIVYADYSSGTWSFNIDGGTATTVTCTGPGTQAGATMKKVGATVTPGTTHTLTITGSTAGNVLILQGVTIYYGSTGIGFVRNCYPGMRMGDLLSQSGSGYGASGSVVFPPDKIKLWQGLQSDGTATGFGFPTGPDLAVMEFGINDCNLGGSVKNFAIGFRRHIAAFRRAKPNCSVVILAVYQNDTASSDNTAGGRGYDWPQYKAVMENIARTYKCAFVDMEAKWGSTPVGQGYMITSDIHPTDAGHADIAAVLSSIL